MEKLFISQKNKIFIIYFILIVFTLNSNLFAKNKKILFLIGEPFSPTLAKSIEKLDKAIPSINLKNNIDFYVTQAFSKINKDKLSQYDIVFVDIMYPITQKIVNFLPKTVKAYSLRTKTGSSSWKKGLDRLIYDEKILNYFKQQNVYNIVEMLKYILNKENIYKINFKPPQKRIKVFLSHPDTDKIFSNYNDYINWYKKTAHYNKNGFWVGITYFPQLMKNQLIKEVVKRFEDSGINVIVAYSFPAYLAVNKFFIDKLGKSRVDFLIGLSFKLTISVGDKGKKVLKKLNVPVYNAINLYHDSKDKWIVSDKGLTPFEVSFQIAIPEIGGLIEPTVIGSKERVFNHYLQKDVYLSKSIDFQVDYLIKRIKAMMNLKIKPNKDKKIAIIYYNHHPGKQNIGASYLNVMKSLSNILQNLRKAGYKIPNNIKLDYETLKSAMLLSGRNVGNYAPGEIEKLVNTKKVVLLPVAEYKKWIKNMPDNFINPVFKKWGKPEDSKIMFYKGNFIIPLVKISDNIIILPQPSRGWGQSPLKMYHDVTLPPHHQYVAFYMWLKKKFKADCIIHLGTHGTQEWMPGKQAGTIFWDNGDFLVQDIPVLYPYVMDDVGEAIQAKRRGRAIILSHLTPVIKEGALYDKYKDLAAKIQEYNIAVTKNLELAKQKFLSIKKMILKTGLDKDLRIKNFSEKDVEQVEHYLIELKQEKLPYGLHTYGYIDDNGAKEFAMIIKANNNNAKINFYKQLKFSAKNEIKNLIRGLKAEYIMAGKGNDPIRSIEALPTGRNLYAFDSAKIPSPEAYKLGIKLVNKAIEKYKKEHKKLPEKVEIILWSTSTCRDEGIAISQALYWMGIKPVWDLKGRVKGVEVIPGKVLKRPRIDVMLQPSGLFRDMFPNIIKLLDKAVKLAKNQKDIENFISKHSEIIFKELIKKGVSEKEAKELADIRIFGEPPGAYGAMVSTMTGNSGLWENDKQIGEVYINRLSYGYSSKYWGKSLKSLFKLNAKDVDIVMHTISTNLYGTMDNDDFFQFAGGAVLAIRSITNKNPELYVNRSANPNNAYIEDINKTVGKEFRMRYTNPTWIKGMIKEGYAGARAISNFVEYMWGWQVTVPETIDKTKWQETFDIYVKDKYKLGLKKFFAKENPWAYQSITARMLEAVRKGYWKADKKIMQKLAVEYAVNVVDYGVACCDHTCNNPLLNQMVVNIISVPGVLSPEMVAKFKAIITKAMGKKLDKAVKDRKELLKKISDIVKDMKNKNVNGKYNSKKLVKGFELKEETKKQDSEVSSSGLQWYLIIFVLFFILILVLGILKNKKKYNL